MPFRLAKEATYYEKEVKENEAKLDQMKQENKDPYDIKKFREVLGESSFMIPDSANRLTKSLDDLSLFLDTNSSTLNQQGEYYVAAQAILKEHGMLKDASTQEETTNLDSLADGEAF